MHYVEDSVASQLCGFLPLLTPTTTEAVPNFSLAQSPTCSQRPLAPPKGKVNHLPNKPLASSLHYQFLLLQPLTLCPLSITQVNKVPAQVTAPKWSRRWCSSSHFTKSGERIKGHLSPWKEREAAASFVGIIVVHLETKFRPAWKALRGKTCHPLTSPAYVYVYAGLVQFASNLHSLLRLHWLKEADTMILRRQRKGLFNSTWRWC